MKPIQINDSGPEVTQLQLRLNSALASRPRLKADGRFGPRTEQAVIAFQRSKGLTADGKVGPRTWQALGLKPVPAASPGSGADATARWLQIAMDEAGIEENKLPGQHTARIAEYHQTTTLKATDDETAWCSSFVNWVVMQAGGTGTNSAAAKSWLTWGTPVSQPTPGTIVVLKKKTGGYSSATGSTSGWHVAFFVSKTPTHITLLGGNQSDRVKTSSFSLSTYEVKGYRK
ncbi:TIGR02594 family protein [Aquabacterium sp. A7-Y]|uniref:NlpC/P60 family protein n=1 Tax=Aquabacterium sp. A7-Y TaxID=1349605 RepID=UPI00223DC54A|nr:TIGR02594 family protein [Aquabacterium sp. A7-Y]MCW7539000.1 TIGR02594 family protein [Aquabacterium sp. A7-Y]